MTETKPDKLSEAASSDEAELPTVFRIEFLEKIAVAAKANGFIGLDHLIYVLAKDEQYDYRLVDLWKTHRCDIRGSKIPTPPPDPTPPMIWTEIGRSGGHSLMSILKWRLRIWQGVFDRWCFNIVAGVRSGLERIDFLPVENEQGVRIDPGKDLYAALAQGPFHVKLDDLQRYLQRRKIPVPTMLFGQKGNDERKSFDEVERLLSAAGKELEKVFAAIRDNVGFSARGPKSIEGDWHNTALSFFDNNRNEFTHVKRNHLDNDSVYLFTGGQEKRDFFGKILQQIVKEELKVKLNAQQLYNRYKKATDSTD